MKLVDMTCPGCGARLNVDTEAATAHCEFCGATFPIDHEVQTLKLEGAEQAGYEFERGRQRAQAEAQTQVPPGVQTPPPAPKKRRAWLWVLGWIFIFPVPLTILMLKSPRTKNINPKVRVAIVVAGWLVYFAIGFAYRKPDSETDKTSTSSKATTEQVAETKQEDKQADNETGRGGYANIDALIKRFNETSGLTITDVKEVDNVADKDSGYYRTEYRTTQFQQNAVGAIGQIEGYGQIDIVSYGSFGFSELRVYADAPDKERAGDLFAKMGHVMVEDKYLSNVDEVATKIKEQGTQANTYIGPGYSAVYAYDEIMIDGHAENIH